MDGHTYEREAIEEWLSKNGTSPATGATLTDKTLIPNLSLKKAIQEFSDDPDRRELIEALSIKEDAKEPSFPPGLEAGKRVEILIVGPSGVGKSSLLRHFRNGSFLEETDSTIGLDFEQRAFRAGPVGQRCSAKIWDTSGQAVFRDTIRTQYRGADVILFVFDVSRPETLRALEPYVLGALDSLRGKQPELVLVANKIDLRAPAPGAAPAGAPGGRAAPAASVEPAAAAAKQGEQLGGSVGPDEACAFVERLGMNDYREVSAKTGANVKLTFTRSLAHAAYRAPSRISPPSQQNRSACLCG
eukprot:CAMPEP_0172642176 /NCGR_PEP_ID=MMETSP1068-20121228/231012_1 /TAXON_ID=35684 /ORGANISM="Pseudopedinella elastica, Strain CCMP716" /LENGTH=300 /DNA_ID=CAMNT_0013455931 /DNA_START=78 /DNA_END=980 /DNA_ORIENTATION=+